MGVKTGGGCVGGAAALLLRYQEKAVLEKAFEKVVECARQAKMGKGKSTKKSPSASGAQPKINKFKNKFYIFTFLH